MALVIEVRIGEKILIGDQIVVSPYEIKGKKKVRVRIDAPRDIKITRILQEVKDGEG